MEFPFLSPQVLPEETSKLKFADSHLKTSSKTYRNGDFVSNLVSSLQKGKTTSVYLLPTLKCFQGHLRASP